jgi:hypothetical protein
VIATNRWRTNPLCDSQPAKSSLWDPLILQSKLAPSSLAQVVSACAPASAEYISSRFNLEQRIAACTALRGMELNRFVRRLLGVSFWCEVMDRARAESAIHIRESMGASVTRRYHSAAT